MWCVDGAASFECGYDGSARELAATLCLLMNWWVLDLHYPAMCVDESGSPHSGHASLSASLYLYDSFRCIIGHIGI